MEGPCSSSGYSNSSVVLEEDLFAEALSQFSPVFMSQDGVIGNPTLDDLLIKNEPYPEGYFNDLYPEVRLEEDILMQAGESEPSRLEVVDISSNASDLNSFETTLELPKDCPVSQSLFKSLTQQFQGKISPAEIWRNVTCFVPIIPLAETCYTSTECSTKKGSKRKVRKDEPISKISKTTTDGVKLKKKLVESAAVTSRRLRGRPKKNFAEIQPEEQVVVPNNSEGSAEEVVAALNKSDPTSCSDCGKEFRTSNALIAHQKPLLEEGQEEQRITCASCNLELKTIHCLRHHRRVCHSDEQDEAHQVSSSKECEICNKVFARVASLIYHRRQIHKLGKSVERKFFCNRCDKSFIQKNHLEVHKRSHREDFEGKNIFPECKVCGKVFTRTSGLIYHQRQVHRMGDLVERKFKCTVCEKSFLKKSHLIFHGQIHTGERLFQCRFCVRSFGGTSGRRFHEERVHGESGKDLTQEQIEKNRAESALRGDTDRPHSVAKGENPVFRCLYCSKIFTRLSAKRVHERSHTGEKPYLCMTCGNTYKSSGALKEHEKTAHTHTLDLLCTICGAAFGRQMSLKYHILSKHSEGHKKFKCDHEGCSRAFVQRAKLQRHQRIHQKGFIQCHICSRSLETQELMDRHLKIHELKRLKLAGVKGIVVPRKINPFRKKPPPKPRKERKTPAPIRKLQCDYCEKRFPYQNELDKHTKAIHTGEREFKCTEQGCPKAYISYYKLLNHLRSGHGHVIENNLLDKVSCELCGKVVQGEGRLQIHKNSRHAVDGIKTLKPRTTSPHTTESPRRRKATEKTTDIIVSHESVKNAANPKEVTPIDAPTQLVLPPPMTLPPNTHTAVPQPQPAHAPLRPIVAPQDLPGVHRSMGYGESHNQQAQPYQIPFAVSFPPYSALTPNIPYSTTASFIPANFHSAQYDIQNSIWQTHQGPAAYRSQQNPNMFEPQIPQGNPRHFMDMADDYSSSNYSDLIHLPPQEDDFQQDSNYGDNDTYSSSNADEECRAPIEAAVSAPGARKRGRPKGVKNRRPGEPPKKRAPQKRVYTKDKPRKIYKRQLPCPTCGKIFGTNQHLRNHQNVHNKIKAQFGSEDIKCRVCGKTFERPYHLLVHSVIHDSSIRPFKCPEPGCSDEFRAPAEMRKHRKDHHSPNINKRYRCKVCKEETRTSGELLLHFLQFHKEKMHKCPHPGCDFICPTAGRLKRHGEKHLDQGQRPRPYKCHLCECAYIRGDNLQQHLDTAHDGAGTFVQNATFPCEICAKAFEFEWKLKSHMRKTHGRNEKKSNYIPRTNKPLFYFCEDCDWSFEDAAKLRNHMKSKHAGYTQILCLKQPCEKKFFFVNKLEHHMKTQHDEFTPDDTLKLDELRKTHPAEPEPEIEIVPRRKSLRKASMPRKQYKSKSLGESDDEIKFEEEDEEVERAKTKKGKRRVSRRRKKNEPTSSDYCEASEDEEYDPKYF